MNERLEQEIDKWFGITQRDAAGKSVQDVSDWKESPDVMMCMNVASIRGFAERFYNLALADVKGEVEKELKYSRDSQAFSNRESRENGVDYYNSGSIDTLMKLEDFIDNLTK